MVITCILSNQTRIHMGVGDHVMARARSPSRDKAFELWKESGGTRLLKDIAAELNVTDTQVRKWKNQDKWEEQLKGNVTITKRNVTNKKERTKKELDLEPLQSEDFTDKQRLFCIYYVKTFNATQSAIKAGYAVDSAHVEGSRLLRNAKVAEHIRDLKAELTNGLFLDAMDVLNKYIKIAFTDITDYLTFGQKEVPVMTMFGPMKDEEGNPVTKMINYVEFNESSHVDGSVISEVKQGKDGVAIKLADKMKALEKLSLYFDLFPDKFKRQIEEEKLKLAQRKVSGSDDSEEFEDDGFVDALNAKTKEVWADEEA
jgi:phage terminase small subunit